MTPAAAINDRWPATRSDAPIAARRQSVTPAAREPLKVPEPRRRRDAPGPRKVAGTPIHAREPLKAVVA